MTARSRYSHGEPCWADLQTRDVAGAKEFYAAVFGWSFTDLPTPDGRFYAQAFIGEDLVAVVAPQNRGQEAAATPGQWNIYFAATDAEEVAEDAVHAGGKLEFGPEHVADTGVLAFIAPPGGGTTGIWQAGTHVGSHLYNQAGALAWAELSTPEPQAAVAFFQQLFGHEVTEYPQDDGGSYSTLMVNGGEVAGVVPAEAGEEAAWQIYFGVTDLRKAADAAVAAGGTLLVEPEEHPEEGSLATIQDPQGGVLSLIQTPSPN